MSFLNYRPDIDGLRAVAVMAVVLHHLSSSLVPGGYIGVDVFFVISGYLITKIISREIREGDFSFARFYERRIRRLFPALFLMLVATLAAGWFFLLPSDYLSTFRAALGTVLFSSNIVFWKSMAAGYFAADSKLNPLLHTWSLAVEEQFYLFFPVLLVLCHRFAKRHLVAILTGCALITLLAASLLVKSHEVAVFFLTPFRAWELLAGSLLALDAIPAIKSRVVREVVAGLGLMAILAASCFYDSVTTFPGVAALAPVLGAAAIIHAGGDGITIVGRFLRLRPVVYIGLISYSLYLWHWPLIVLTRFATGMQPLGPYLPAMFAGSLLLGSLSYHFIEEPFRRGSGAGRKRIFAGAAAVAAVLVTVSTFGYLRGGLFERFDAEVIAIDQARDPPIPFRECDGQREWCRIGASGAEPTVLLWGDSHMLAWAPALDRVYSDLGRSAFLVVVSACPPLSGVDSSSALNCFDSNERVRNFLQDNPIIDTVGLSAYWGRYFNDNSPLSMVDHSSTSVQDEPAVEGLKRTLSWLSNLNRDVYLLGPVPFYDSDVPLTVALGKVQNRVPFSMSMEMHRERHSKFFEIVDSMPSGSVHFIDPATWLCEPACVVERRGELLYRDAHHLSTAGAMALFPKLVDSLGGKSTASRQSIASPAAGSSDK